MGFIEVQQTNLFNFLGLHSVIAMRQASRIPYSGFVLTDTADGIRNRKAQSFRADQNISEPYGLIGEGIEKGFPCGIYFVYCSKFCILLQISYITPNFVYCSKFCILIQILYITPNFVYYSKFCILLQILPNLTRNISDI